MDDISKYKYNIVPYYPDVTKSVVWPDIYDSFVVYSNINIDTNELRKLRILDLKGMKEKNIYVPENDRIVDDNRIGSEWVFWVEGRDGNDLYGWEIKACSINTVEVRTLRKNPYGNMSIMMPRIDNDDNTITWVEGFENGDNNKIITKNTMYIILTL